MDLSESLFLSLIIEVGKTSSFNDFLLLNLRRLISDSDVIVPFTLFLLSYQIVLPKASLFPLLLFFFLMNYGAIQLGPALCQIE